MLGNLRLTEDDRVVVGLKTPDDAAVVRLESGRLIVQTVDFFTPIVDDPYLFGQIAAANSLSDIYAMGARPTFALNIAGFPVNDLPLDYLTRILQGGADKALEAGISIVGGHSIDDKEPKYGLVVTGEVDENKLVTVSQGMPGDSLVLTKPLGTGILSTALKKELITEADMADAITSMKTLNRTASDIMVSLGVKAATDITGFGLAGHLHEICHASNCAAEINLSKFHFFKGTQELADNGIIPGGTKRNLDYFGEFINFDDKIDSSALDLLADPQTSGGLLIACPPDKASKFMESFNRVSDIEAFQVGRLTESGRFDITVLP